MDALQFVFFPYGGQASIKQKSVWVADNHMIVTRQQVSFEGVQSSCFGFSAAELQLLQYEIAHLLDLNPAHQFKVDDLYLLPLDIGVMQAGLSLLGVNRAAMLRFIYIYCLLSDCRYFSTLLELLTAGAPQFYEFIERNALQPWSVAQFAEKIDMPVRKFNLLFQEKFGTSAKNWLLGKRLEHAEKLLQLTSKKVIDVAMECGFSSHGHFSNSFRRHFNLTPKACRQMSRYEKYVAGADQTWISLR